MKRNSGTQSRKPVQSKEKAEFFNGIGQDWQFRMTVGLRYLPPRLWLPNSRILLPHGTLPRETQRPRVQKGRRRSARRATRIQKKTQRGQSTTCSADYESGDQRVGGSGILLHQAFQCHRELVDRVRRGEVQGLGKGLIGDRSRLPDNLAEMSSDAERQDVDRARGGSNIKTNVSQRYTPNFAPTCNVSSKQSNSTGELASRPSAKVRKGPLYASRVATWEQLKNSLTERTLVAACRRCRV